MIKLNSEEKKFLKEHEDKIRADDYKSILEDILIDRYIDRNLIINVFKDLGVDLIDYSEFNVGDKVKIKDSGEIHISYFNFSKSYNLPAEWVNSDEPDLFGNGDTVQILFKAFDGDGIACVITKKNAAGQAITALIDYFGLERV